MTCVVAWWRGGGAAKWRSGMAGAMGTIGNSLLPVQLMFFHNVNTLYVCHKRLSKVSRRGRVEGHRDILNAKLMSLRSENAYQCLMKKVVGSRLWFTLSASKRTRGS